MKQATHLLYPISYIQLLHRTRVCLLVCVFLDFLTRLKLEPFRRQQFPRGFFESSGRGRLRQNHHYYFPLCVVSPCRHSR